MIRNLALALGMTVFLAAQSFADTGDPVLDWNDTVCGIIQLDGTHPIHKANPGWSTRSMAMMNTAIYDAFQAVNRTHQPFLYTQKADSNLPLNVNAAVHRAAYLVLKDCYGGETSALDAAYNSRIGGIADGDAKTNGIALGEAIAQQCMNARDNPNDGSDPNLWQPYTALDGPGYWRPQPGQSAWGPGWGSVKTFGVPSAVKGAMIDALPPLPALTDPAYTAAFDEVKTWGALTGSPRTTHETETGLFWAYDRPSMGPPPVLFLANIKDICQQIGSGPEDNARLFAMASVAQADAAIAAWDAKFADNFWRPIGAIQGDRLDGTKGHDDGNPNTAEDATWLPLGAPGGNPLSSTDDFTPPFPAYTSGHATMGGAIFKTLETFFGNNFQAADALYDAGDPVTAQYDLHAAEFNAAGIAGMVRSYSAFTQDPSQWGIGLEGQENTPESENAMSRIYLGIHWIMDQKDGTLLGNNIAEYIADNMFQAVPEPTAGVIALTAIGAAALRRRRRTA